MGIFSLVKDKLKTKDAEQQLGVGPRAKSEFFHLQKHAKFAGGAEDEPALGSGPHEGILFDGRKSFSNGKAGDKITTSVFPEPARGSAPGLGHITFTNLHQFSNKVELYRGSISTVYKAVCIENQQTVIIKIYDKGKMKLKNTLRMEREIRLMKMLTGPGMVSLYGVFEDDARKSLVMEYCSGGDLFKYLLLRGGHLDEHWVCTEVIAPLLRVLVSLHNDHVLHRDIKPENIFLTADHKLKLGDMGLAIQNSMELAFTRSGTLDYMAPEVLANPSADIQESPAVTKADLKQRGIRPYDDKVDVWATGILAYELVVGRPPFEVNDEVQTATMIMFNNNISYPSKHSGLWADFVKQSLEKKPHLRPTAEKMLDHPWVHLHETKATKQPAPDTVTLADSQASAEQLQLPLAVQAVIEQLPQNEKPPIIDNIPAVPIFRKSASMVNPSTNFQAKEGRGFQEAASPSTSASAAAATSSPKKMPIQAQDALPLHPFDPRRVPGLSSQGSGSVESSNGSFNTLMKKVSNGSVPNVTYTDSGADFLGEADRARGGMRVRMKHYFARQQKGLAQQPL
ncbi:hypothetical protein WJX74_001365 [Apatococcus lobatus]|uniref:Protein kinase domain-containing protein n=1 Tax=Apatococcus lobatus TaxID=904363 RepID=A0AAW1SDK7_9CHLO